jgi:hypothetical protein
LTAETERPDKALCVFDLIDRLSIADGPIRPYQKDFPILPPFSILTAAYLLPSIFPIYKMTAFKITQIGNEIRMKEGLAI